MDKKLTLTHRNKKTSMSNQISAFLKTHKLHFIIWTVFILHDSMLFGLVQGSFGTLSVYIAYYGTNIFLFYIHGRLVLPYIFKGKRRTYWKMPFVLLAELLAFVFLVYCGAFISNEQAPYNLETFLNISGRWLYFSIFGTGYYFLVTYLNDRRLQEQIEKENLINIAKQKRMLTDLAIAENAYLRARINPHFFFNTLDVIYHDAVNHSTEGAEALLGLVKIMRFALDTGCLGEYIEMGLEIDQIEALVNLHNLGSGGKKTVIIHSEEGLRSLKIIPLVILGLVENMYKHGDLKEKDAHINMYTKNSRIHIHTLNYVHPNHQTSRFGPGLTNIEKRLFDAYKGKAEFVHASKGSTFKVDLSVPVIASQEKESSF